MISLSINLIIALLWLFLSTDPNPGTLVVGYLVGLMLIAAFRRLLNSEDYVRRTIAFFRFILLFFKEVTLSTIGIASAALFKRNDEINPDFLELDVSELTKGEILLLSHCITLTPGTTSIDISSDFQRLTIHAFDAANPGSVRESINTGLRDPILAFTRPWTSS
jgi:multicomponent Na+:H+ antiporter subunit E